MKLRIQTDGTALSGPSRARIEQRVRLIVGARAARIEAVQILLTSAADASTRLRCKVRLKGDERAFELPEEASESIETVVELTIWRLRHFIDRRALRNDRERRSA